MPSAKVAIKSALASDFGLELSRILSWTPLLYITRWLFNDIINFWRMLYESFLKMCLSCKAEIGFLVQWSCSVLLGRYLAVVECNVSRKLDCIFSYDCMVFSVAPWNSDGFFSLGDTWRCLCTASQDCQRSCGKNSGSCDSGGCQYVNACWTTCHAAHYPLPWSIQMPLQTPTVTMRSKCFIIWQFTQFESDMYLAN
jgi:hypothetical protein